MVALDKTLRPAFGGVLFHHERWDGGGYPTGCSGVQIPLEARVLAVVDCYDAMTSDRPYRSALPPKAAAAEVDRCAGTQFDPDIAVAFLDAWESGALGVTAALARRRDRLATASTRPRASCFTRRITSSVNSVVPAWPPRSAVRTPSATASRHASRIARPASRASLVRRSRAAPRRRGSSPSGSRRSCPGARARCRARPRP